MCIGAHDEEGGAEEHAVVLEYSGTASAATNIAISATSSAATTPSWVDGVRQLAVALPQRAQNEHAP